MIENLNHFAWKSIKKNSAFTHLKPQPNPGINPSTCTFGPRQRAHFRWYAAANGRLRKVQISVSQFKGIHQESPLTIVDKCNDYSGLSHINSITLCGWQPFLGGISPWKFDESTLLLSCFLFKFVKLVWYLYLDLLLYSLAASWIQLSG